MGSKFDGPLRAARRIRRIRGVLAGLAIAASALETSGVTPASASTTAAASAVPVGQFNPRLEHRATGVSHHPILPSHEGLAAAPAEPLTTSFAAAGGPPSCNAGWGSVPSSNYPANNELEAVAATSTTNMWAVGVADPVGFFQTLTEFWNGSAWTIAPSPNPNSSGTNLLNSVATTDANGSIDTWAVGGTRPGLSSGPYSTLIEHIVNNGWATVVSPNPSTGSNSLFSIKGDRANDYWAVGRSWLSSTSSTPLAEHWDGNAWTIVATPTLSPGFSQFIAVSVLSPTNVWAVGDTSTDGVTYLTLIEHYDGSSWTVSPSPQSVYGNGALFGISGSPADLYAVGVGTSPAGADQSLIEHWNGTSWATIPNAPTGADTDLFSVASISASNVWAVGTTFGGTAQQPEDSPFIAHWDGTTWTVPPQPLAVTDSTSSLFDIAAVAASDVWAVGGISVGGGYEQTLSWNYCQPPTVTSINPTSGPAPGGTSVSITGTGLIWTAGVNFGNTPASVGHGSASDTQIGVTSPPGRAGVVDVRVTYFGGESAVTPADRFTYIATVPEAPVNVAAVPRDASAIVYWHAPPSDGGVDITSYTVMPYIGGVAQTATIVTGNPPPTSTNVTRLTDGTTYAFKVSATNTVGQGPDSDPSSPVSPSATAIPNGPEISSWGPGRLDVFIKGADGALWHKFYASSLGWSGWSSLGAPTGVTLASDPVAMSWGYARIDIFVRGSDNALWHKYYDVNLGGWSAWYSHGGMLTSGPTATSWGFGRLDVFYRGTDNTLRHIFYAAFIGAWSAEYNHGGALASDPSAVSWGVGRIDVVARGNDGSLQHSDYDQSRGGWLPAWESLAGDTIQAGPTITTWGTGRLDVFTRGNDNALHHIYFYNGAWSGWSEHANPANNVLISDPGAIAWGPGRIDIFARGDNDILLHKFYDSSVGWSGWFLETLSPTPG